MPLRFVLRQRSFSGEGTRPGMPRCAASRAVRRRRVEREVDLDPFRAGNFWKRFQMQLRQDVSKEEQDVDAFPEARAFPGIEIENHVSRPIQTRNAMEKRMQLERGDARR